MAFQWLSCDCLSFAELLPGKKTEVFFLLGSAIILGHESSPFRSPDSTYLRFLFVNFLHFTFLNKPILGKHCWSRVRFSVVSAAYFLQCQKENSLGIVSHIGGKVNRLETYWGHIQVTWRDRRENAKFFSLFYFF